MSLDRETEAFVPANGAMLHIRIDERVKGDASTALAAMDLSASDAVRLLFRRIIADQAFPLELKGPNAESRAALAEADAILTARRARFSDASLLIADLDGQVGYAEGKSGTIIFLRGGTHADLFQE